MEDKDKYYIYLNHEKWCDLLYTLESKDNWKRAAAQIKRLMSQKVVSLEFERDTSFRVTHKKKDMTVFLPSFKQQGNINPKQKRYILKEKELWGYPPWCDWGYPDKGGGYRLLGVSKVD